MEKEKNISALVVGSSGAGKSEFILSFIDKEARKKIPASGAGQTTRTSMKYVIDCKGAVPLQMKVELKDREQFVRERLGALHNENLCFDNSYSVAGMKERLLEDEAFFHIEEFGENVENQISDKYDEIFSEEFYNDVETQTIQKEQGVQEEIYVVSRDRYENIQQLLGETVHKVEENGEEQSKVSLDDCFEVFLRYVYEQCIGEIFKEYEKSELNNLAHRSSEELAMFLKTQEGKISYSSLVKEIVICTRVAEYYRKFFTRLQIEKVCFIDTYGLDHAEALSEDNLRSRYMQLFRENTIKTVFYIRKVDSTEAPTDLETAIPTLLEVDKSIVPYIIFTKVDKLETGEKVENTKAYCKISRLRSKLGEIMLKKGYVGEFVENRLNNLLDTRIGYCSYIGKKEGYEQYLGENKRELKKLFLAIINKSHYGTQVISLNKLKKEVPIIERFFFWYSIGNLYAQWEVFNSYSSRTTRKLIQCLQSGYLGFKGTTTEFFWNDIIKDRIQILMQVIKNNKKEDGSVEGVEGVGLDELKQYLETEHIDTFLELVCKYTKYLSSCYADPTHYFYTNRRYCVNCTTKDKCIKEILYQEKIRLIHWEHKPVFVWLNAIHNFEFEKVGQNTKDSLNKIAEEIFETRFKGECREHNINVMATELVSKNLVSPQNIELRLREYYEKYDSNLGEEEQGRLKHDLEEKVQFLLSMQNDSE